MIRMVTALHNEAKPLVDFYHLKPAANHPYKIYKNGQIFLIVSGVGKKNVSAAAAYLHDYSGKNRNSGWLNIGIGGHSVRNLGEGVIVHKITDQATRESWFPPRILQTDCPSESVLTVEKVELKYRDHFIYDMEASGFYEAASSFATSEIVQCFKIISDNLNTSSQKVSGALVRGLVAQNLNSINSIVKELSKLSAELSALELNPEELDLFLKRYHFTVTESHQLRRLLSRLKTLQPKENWFSKGSQFLTTKDILKFLEHQIETTPVYL